MIFRNRSLSCSPNAIQLSAYHFFVDYNNNYNSPLRTVKNHIKYWGSPVAPEGVIVNRE
jgi:hypothetical protein